MLSLSQSRISCAVLAGLLPLQTACMASSPKPTLPLSAGVQQPPAVFTHEGKRIVYEDSGGSGPVVLCLPGLGDTRAQFRELAPRLAAAGYRVLAVDPRGQGGSDTGWRSYTPEALGDDAAALIAHLGVPNAYLVGNSYGAAAAAWVAATRPEAVRGLVLIGPFVRNVTLPWHQRAMIRVAFAGPWAPDLWESHYKTLYPVTQPADLDAYAAALKASLQEPGRLDVLRAMMRASKGHVAERLGDVRAPTLVVMGETDPDFQSPAEEARLVAQLVRGEVTMIAGAGHYPHVDAPGATFETIARFFDAH